MLSGKLTQQLPPYLLEKYLLISALQLPLGTVEARDSRVLPHLETGYRVCKGVSKKGQPLSAFQVAADILKHFYCNSPATQLWKQFLFSVENPEIVLLILIQNRLFSNLLTLFSEVQFSRMQDPNSRP